MATVYCTATSLDGYIADHDESLSWLFATSGDAEPADYGPSAPDSSLPKLHFDRFFAGVGRHPPHTLSRRWRRVLLR